MAIKNNSAGIKDLTDAKNAISRSDALTVQSNLDFYYGDHWQGSDAWAGPYVSSSVDGYADLMSEIERGFVSDNVIKEVVDRVVNAVAGRDPQFTLSYPDRRNTRIVTEAEETVKKWMKDKDFKRSVQKALRHALLSGKSTIRLFIPSGLLNRDGSVNVNPDNPLDLLYVDAPDPLAGAVVRDEDTMEKTAVFVGKTKDDRGRDKEVAVISYLLPVADKSGVRFTEFTIIPERGVPSSAALNLNGKLLMFELEMPRLITEQVRSLQKFMNLNLTMMQRNSVLGGYLERVILNGQLPGHYEDDGQGGQVYVREEFATGAGTINAINGLPTVDENGNITGYTSASMMYRDPVAVTTFKEGKDTAYHAILSEVQQIHAVLSGDAVASGDSRRQALAAFASSLRIPKQVLEQALEWLIETVLACAGTFSGNPDKFKGITAKAECKLDLGPPATNEQDIVERLVRSGIISLQTAREMFGIQDLEEEERRVQAGLPTVKAAAQIGTVVGQLDNNTDNRDKINTDEQGAEE